VAAGVTSAIFKDNGAKTNVFTGNVSKQKLDEHKAYLRM